MTSQRLMMRRPWAVEQHSHARRVNRRALTLFELLIAIAIIAAMTAIVAPNLLGRVDERRFDATIDAVTQQLLLARAHAQTTGATVQVQWRIDDRDARTGAANASRIEVTVLPPDAPDDVADAVDDAEPIERPEFGPPPGADDEQDPTIIYEAWASLPLPRGCRITDVEPSWLDQDVSLSPGRHAIDTLPESAALDDAEVIRLVVFLPDGSALFASPCWLIDDARRTAALTIRPWSGLPTIERLEPSTNGRVAADDQDDIDVADADDALPAPELNSEPGRSATSEALHSDDRDDATDRNDADETS